MGFNHWLVKQAKFVKLRLGKDHVEILQAITSKVGCILSGGCCDFADTYSPKVGSFIDANKVQDSQYYARI